LNSCAVAERTAVILFNLGGPDKPESVRPFLQNLFSDPAIIGLPFFMRLPLAKLMAARREEKAQDIYAKIGGKSPLLENTSKQAAALEHELGEGFRCFVSMRYWHPFSRETAQQVGIYKPDKTVFLPLYPQFSTTTTASSFRDFPKKPDAKICCYPANEGFIKAQADLIKPVLQQAGSFGSPRLLFSAHGLPEKTVQSGDPYQWQCEQTALALVRELGEDVDFVNCYQSRVGPLNWIGPSTEGEIRRAGYEGTPVVVVPLSFVSEHSETLVELDIDYHKLAWEQKVPFYGRVPTVGTHPAFIRGLADMVQKALAGEKPCAITCPSGFGACPCQRE